MLYATGALLLLGLGLLVYCLLDAVTTPSARVRTLPKPAWVALVVLAPVVGSIAWLLAGRPQGPAAAAPHEPGGGTAPRPGRVTATAPDDPEAFLRGLRERAEEQRRKARRDGSADPG